MTTWSLAAMCWLLLLCVTVTSAEAQPATRPDLLEALGKERLSQPGIASAYPCDDAWLAGQEGTVVDLAGWLEAAGLRRGDRFIAIGGVSVAESGDWRYALQRTRPDDYLELAVEGVVPPAVELG